jgi:16S rRNA processing protein RimM
MALLEVAQIARAHGLRGEVVVDLLTNREERLEIGSILVAGAPKVGAIDGEVAISHPGPKEPTQTLEVVASRPFQHRWIVSFKGVTTREAAEALHGAPVYAEPIEDEDALFVHELIGRELIDQHGIGHGMITAVQANPASDLLVIENSYLVPVGFVTNNDAGHVYADIPDGLFDL